MVGGRVGFLLTLSDSVFYKVGQKNQPIWKLLGHSGLDHSGHSDRVLTCSEGTTGGVFWICFQGVWVMGLQDILDSMAGVREQRTAYVGTNATISMEQLSEPATVGDSLESGLYFDSSLLFSIRDGASVARIKLDTEDLEEIIQSLLKMQSLMKATQAALDEKFPRPVADDTEEDAE